jgi:hypothetical protein
MVDGTDESNSASAFDAIIVTFLDEYLLFVDDNNTIKSNVVVAVVSAAECICLCVSVCINVFVLHRMMLFIKGNTTTTAFNVYCFTMFLFMISSTL